MLDLTALILLALSVLSPPPQRPMTTRATRYADTARDEGGTPRCVHELPRDVYRALHPLRVAHRTLPCGTLLVVEAGGRRTLAAVLDRGPWNRVGLPWSAAPRHPMAHPPRSGAAGAAPQVADTSAPPPAPPYRGDLDVSPRPADALGLTLRVGRLRVRYWRAAWQPFAVRRRPPNS
jgi:hypothetical protein